MTRRHWIRTLCPGLSAFLLSGCLQAPLRPADPPADPGPKGPPATGGRSDYNERPYAGPTGRSALQPAHLEVPPPPPPAKPPAADPPVSSVPVILTPSAPRPTPPEPPLVASLRCVLDKHPDRAAEQLQAYDRPNRQLLFTLLSLAGDVASGQLERVPPQDADAMLDQLNTLALALRLRSPLKLRKACFCSQPIEAFGRYVPLPGESVFQAGSGGHPGEHLWVYAEVENFSSLPVGPFYETHLRGTVEIYNARGERMVQWNSKPQVDRSRTLRQDYFISFDFCLPPKLPPGSYTLWVKVKDVTPGPVPPRAARCSLDFQVVGGGWGPSGRTNPMVMGGAR